MANRINVKLILELKSGGMSQNEIARTRHMSRTSVSTVVNIAKEKSISFEDILNLSKHYPNSRFEDACRIALNNTTSPRYKYLKALLSNNQDILERERVSKQQSQENHSIAEEQGAYVRGAGYYGGGDHHDK